MSAGRGGNGGVSGWALDWTKKGVVIGGVTGVAFGPAAAYSLLALLGTGVGIGIAALIIAVGSLVTSVQAADITWGPDGISVGSQANTAPAAPHGAVAKKTTP